MRRDLLVLQGAASSLDVCAALSERGWNVARTFAIDELIGDPPADDGTVGLLVVDAVASFPIASVERLMAKSNIDWVAVLPRELAQRNEYARLLAHSFADFHTLPLDLERLAVVLGHLHGRADLRRALAASSAKPTGQYGMTGASAPMLDLYRSIDKIVRVDAPVLIIGESGTGKEVIARNIHEHSLRRARPFVAVNCGAMPAGLVQSELFGHEKGSFTGAHQRKVGSIEAAEGGTIFLDEIGDLPLESQASLLRFLQEHTITRVGSTSPIRIEARVIAATHVDLQQAVRERRFREDLYYRLNVLHVNVPPLRSRGADVALLAEEMFKRFIGQKAAGVRGLSDAALDALEAHDWPGNVRELINRMQQAMIMSEGPLIQPADLGLETQRPNAAGASLTKARLSTERDAILAALQRSGHNVAAAARSLGISRVTLYRMLQRHRIVRASNNRLNGHIAHSEAE